MKEPNLVGPGGRRTPPECLEVTTNLSDPSRWTSSQRHGISPFKNRIPSVLENKKYLGISLVERVITSGFTTNRTERQLLP